jgi:uncharacterized protein YegP (UPF0339 family)
MAARFEIRKGRKLFRQKFYVATIGNNGEVLQTSELLSSENDCHTNINAVREVSLKGIIINAL